jgi:hypothetical protein
VFFAINASISGALAASGNADLWLLYTGLLAYLAVGVLFAVEFSVRAWRFGRHEGTLLGPLYRRIFALLGHVPRRAARAPGAPARSRGAPQ